MSNTTLLSQISKPTDGYLRGIDQAGFFRKPIAWMFSATGGAVLLVLSLCSCSEGGTLGDPVTDIDGNVYRTMQIGTQLWMQENLRTTRYNDGRSIPLETNDYAWTQVTTGAYCDCGNEPGYDTLYGKLYNWYAAANPKICPQGWHVPTDEDWQQLELALGMAPGDVVKSDERGKDQNMFRKMKGCGFFDDHCCGSRYAREGAFARNGSSVSWWTASENGSDDAWFHEVLDCGRSMDAVDARGIIRNLASKTNGFCVRCVEDSTQSHHPQPSVPLSQLPDATAIQAPASAVTSVDVGNKTACLHFLNGHTFSVANSAQGGYRRRLRFNDNNVRLTDADNEKLIGNYRLELGPLAKVDRAGFSFRYLYLWQGSQVVEMGLFEDGNIFSGSRSANGERGDFFLPDQ